MLNHAMGYVGTYGHTAEGGEFVEGVRKTANRVMGGNELLLPSTKGFPTTVPTT